MSWIEEVVRRLESVKTEADIILDERWSGLKPSKKQFARFVSDRVGAALAAIPEEDPMEKLLDWLRENYNLDNQLVIDYIKKELGYGKENE